MKNDLEKVFTVLQITSAAFGPKIAFFKRFKSKWFSIDCISYQKATGMQEITLFRDRKIEFSLEKLKRSAYQEITKSYRNLQILGPSLLTVFT